MKVAVYVHQQDEDALLTPDIREVLGSPEEAGGYAAKLIKEGHTWVELIPIS